MSKGVQDYGMKILYPLHGTSFDTILDDENKDADTTSE